MPVGTVIKDYYTGHLTAGKKPVVYIVTPGYGGAQFQIACKVGKEKELIKYLQDTRKEIFHAEEFDYHWLKEDVQALYDDDRRVATVFTLFATISIFVSALGLFGLSLFDIRQRYREIAIRKVNGAELSAPEEQSPCSQTLPHGRPVRAKRKRHPCGCLLSEIFFCGFTGKGCASRFRREQLSGCFTPVPDRAPPDPGWRAGHPDGCAPCHGRRVRPGR